MSQELSHDWMPRGCRVFAYAQRLDAVLCFLAASNVQYQHLNKAPTAVNNKDSIDQSRNCKKPYVRDMKNGRTISSYEFLWYTFC